MIIEVDFTKAVPTELIDSLRPEVINAIMADVAEAARDHWIKIAGKELFTSRRDYLAGIQPVEFGNNTATIALVGQVPNIVENGVKEEIDLRDTLLGPNVPVVVGWYAGKKMTIRPDGRVGFYRAIPFRHATPGTKGAVGQPMGRPYTGHEAVQDAKKLGEDVYNAAKKLKAATSDPYNKKVKWAGKKGRLPAGVGGAPLLRPHHRSDIYAGMVKQQKKYVHATQSQYVTFRTISTLVPRGWKVQPREGKHFAQRVSDHVRKLGPQAIEAFVKGLGG